MHGGDGSVDRRGDGQQLSLVRRVLGLNPGQYGAQFARGQQPRRRRFRQIVLNAWAAAEINLAFWMSASEVRLSSSISAFAGMHRLTLNAMNAGHRQRQLRRHAGHGGGMIAIRRRRLDLAVHGDSPAERHLPDGADVDGDIGLHAEVIFFAGIVGGGGLRLPGLVIQKQAARRRSGR